MSLLRETLEDYLRLRRQLGFELRNQGSQLSGFVGFLEQGRAQRITTELAVTWARLPANVHPFTWHQRLAAVREFARYMSTIEPDTEIPAANLLSASQQRVPPYIYSETEIKRLMDACHVLLPPLRAPALETLIGLMATTGLRLGEALALDRHDVDLGAGVLHIRGAKKYKQREVPMHHTTTAALCAYAELRDHMAPSPQSPAFFLNTFGRRMHHRTVHDVFPRLIRKIGLEGCGQRTRPRPHDLRHAFAVRTLLDWNRAGRDVQRDLPLLSTFMGHAHPRNTYWYLEAVPELLQLIGQRLDGALGDVV